MISLKSFLVGKKCDEALSDLLGDFIPAALIKIRAAIDNQTDKYTGTDNASGDHQLALDVQCNEIMKKACEDSGLVHSYASEEEESQLMIKSDAPFTLCTDPLDGSSLANVNFAVGTIIGIYPAGELKGRTGDDQLAACFAVYGPRTTLVVTIGDGTHAFKLAPDGVFYLEKGEIKVEKEAKYFAPGNLRVAAENANYLELVEKWIKEKLTLRYSGGMVPDINHIFMKGSGIFCYPGYSEKPNGKLRLLYECAPMAMLMEQAGGIALGGEDRILALEVSEYAQTTPIYLGSKRTVEDACGKI